MEEVETRSAERAVFLSSVKPLEPVVNITEYWYSHACAFLDPGDLGASFQTWNLKALLSTTVLLSLSPRQRSCISFLEMPLYWRKRNMIYIVPAQCIKWHLAALFLIQSEGWNERIIPRAGRIIKFVGMIWFWQEGYLNSKLATWQEQWNSENIVGSQIYTHRGHNDSLQDMQCRIAAFLLC